MKGTIELLAPAGDMERLRMAVAYGADAVYLAGTTFGLVFRMSKYVRIR